MTEQSTNALQVHSSLAVPDAWCQRHQHAIISNAMNDSSHHTARLHCRNRCHLLFHHSRLQTEHRQTIQLTGPNHPAFDFLPHLVSLQSMAAQHRIGLEFEKCMAACTPWLCLHGCAYGCVCALLYSHIMRWQVLISQDSDGKTIGPCQQQMEHVTTLLLQNMATDNTSFGDWVPF